MAICRLSFVHKHMFIMCGSQTIWTWRIKMLCNFHKLLKPLKKCLWVSSTASSYRRAVLEVDSNLHKSKGELTLGTAELNHAPVWLSPLPIPNRWSALSVLTGKHSWPDIITFANLCQLDHRNPSASVLCRCMQSYVLMHGLLSCWSLL